MTTATPAPQLLRLADVLLRTGTARAKHYRDIQDGLMVKPVTRGRRFARWPASEVDAVVAAYIAGGGDDTVRSLVAALHAARAPVAHPAH